MLSLGCLNQQSDLSQTFSLNVMTGKKDFFLHFMHQRGAPNFIFLLFRVIYTIRLSKGAAIKSSFICVILKIYPHNAFFLSLL